MRGLCYLLSGLCFLGVPWIGLLLFIAWINVRWEKQEPVLVNVTGFAAITILWAGACWMASRPSTRALLWFVAAVVAFRLHEVCWAFPGARELFH